MSDRNELFVLLMCSFHESRLAASGRGRDSFATKAPSRVSIIAKNASVESYVFFPPKFLLIFTNISKSASMLTTFSCLNVLQYSRAILDSSSAKSDEFLRFFTRICEKISSLRRFASCGICKTACTAALNQHLFELFSKVSILCITFVYLLSYLKLQRVFLLERTHSRINRLTTDPKFCSDLLFIK